MIPHPNAPAGGAEISERRTRIRSDTARSTANFQGSAAAFAGMVPEAPRPMRRTSAWSREPLVHFLLLGAALFAVYAQFGHDLGKPASNEIVVTAGRIRSLVQTFARQRNRAPSDEELAGLVREFVREEALAREATRLGLDRDDTVVRRRLAQKMEFLSRGDAAPVEPTDDELRAYLAAHPERFRLDSRFWFRQVLLDRSRRGDRVEADAARFLAALNGPGSPQDLHALGDGLLLGDRFDDVSRRAVEAQFGKPFADRLESLPLGRFEGPIESGYGLHLVRVERRTPGRLPALAEVRDAVVREWSGARERTDREARMRALLSHYEVTIEELKEPRRTAAAAR